MRRLYRTMAAAVILGFAMLGTPAAGRETAAAEIDRVQQDWVKALVTPDLAALDALYAPDLVYVHSDARIQNKAEFLEPFRTGRARFRALTRQGDPRVIVRGDTAVVSARYELVVETEPGKTNTSTHQFMTVLVRAGSLWHIVAQQTTRVPPA